MPPAAIREVGDAVDDMGISVAVVVLQRLREVCEFLSSFGGHINPWLPIPPSGWLARLPRAMT
jgi:hypothetical protein